MSRRWWRVVVLLAGSEILGLLSGHWYFGIFNRTVPSAMVTDFSRAAAHGYFLYRGALLGFVFFLWSLAAATVFPLFRPRTQTASTLKRNHPN
jgi:hypothetical protein